MAPDESTHTTGYETRDVSVRGVLLLGIALVVVAVIVHVALWWMFNQMKASAKHADPAVSPLAGQADRAPGPELELKLRYTDFDAADQQHLEHYGWADREQKVMHIPIERAMELLAERGLPEPAGPVQQPNSDEPGKIEEANQ